MISDQAPASGHPAKGSLHDASVRHHLKASGILAAAQGQSRDKLRFHELEPFVRALGEHVFTQVQRLVSVIPIALQMIQNTIIAAPDALWEQLRSMTRLS